MNPGDKQRIPFKYVRLVNHDDWALVGIIPDNGSEHRLSFNNPEKIDPIIVMTPAESLSRNENLTPNIISSLPHDTLLKGFRKIY